MSTIQGYQNIKSGEYFIEQIDYYQKQFVAEARKQFPQHGSLSDDELMKHPEVQETASKNPLAPVFMGKIARDLGLEGKLVDPESFKKLCAGYEPNADLNNNPTKLNNTAFDIVDGKIQFPTTEADDRRVGLEIIFTHTQEWSNISAQASILDPELYAGMMSIRQRALELVLEEMEKDAIVRKSVNGKVVEERASGLIAVPNHHGENRGPQGGLPEPFDHTHFIVMNTAKDREGNYYSLDNSLIAKKKAYYNSLYCSLLTEMAREELGFETQPVYVKGDDPEKNPFKKETARGVLTHTIKVPEKFKKLVDTFSQRSKEIQQEANEGVAKYLAENGNIVEDSPFLRGDTTKDTDSVEAKSLAQLKTKNSKTDKTLGELQQYWRTVGAELSITAEDLKALRTYKEADKNRIGFANALAKVGKSMQEFERELIESYHDYAKEPATREEAIVGFFVRKLVSYTNRRDAERLAEEIFERHFIGCLTDDTKDKLERVLDKDKPIQAQENAQLLYQKGLLYMDKTLVANEKRMINGWEARRADKNFLIATPDVVGLIKKFNEGILADTLKRHEKQKTELTSEYLASLDKEKRDKAIKDFAELTTKVEAIKELQALEKKLKEGLNPAEQAEAANRLAFLKNDKTSPLPKLSDEQVNAILNSTTKTGGICIIEGLPGTGKSFASKVIKEAYEQRGFNVIAVGTSALNTKNLQQSIGTAESSNIAKLLTDLDSGKQKLSGKDVIIADEMGMCDLRMWIRLSDHINSLPANDRPKLIAMGQTEQLTPVGLGQGFTTLSRRNFNTTSLTIVNRQEENWQRQMTQYLSEGNGDLAIKRYHDEGKVNIKAKTIDAAIANAVDGYFKTGYRDKVVITDTNEVADKLNVAIRSRVREDLAKKIDADSLKLEEKLQAGEINRAKYQEGMEALKKSKEALANQVSVDTKDFGQKEFMVGDKIMFLGTGTTHFNDKGKVIKNHREKQNASFGLNNGEQAVVVAVDTKKKTMTVKVSDGSERTISTAQKLDLSHAYSYSIHKSQGQSLDYVGVVISKVQALNPMLVALSRHKKDMGVFLNDELKGELNATVRIKRSALPEDVALIKKYVDYQHIKLKEKNSRVEEWTYGRAKDFIEKNGIREFFKLEKHPLEEYESLLFVSTVLEVKKTTQDYQIIDTRTATMMAQIDKGLEDKANAEQQKLNANQVYTTKEQVSLATGDMRTAEQRRRHHAQDGQESLAKTSGLSSLGKLSSIKSIAKEHQEALRKKMDESMKKVADALKDNLTPKSKIKKKVFAQ